MARGPFGGPRPLVSVECFLTVYEYSALPSTTISGDTSPDRSDEFRQAAGEFLPVERFTSEPHPTNPDQFGDVLGAQLDSDRLPLDRYLEFVRGYARILGVENLQKINAGIDTRIETESRVPRPLAEIETIVVLTLEITFPEGVVDRLATELEAKFGWIVDHAIHSSESAVFQHIGGENDLVVTQLLDLAHELEGHGVSIDDAIISCSVLEQ